MRKTLLGASLILGLMTVVMLSAASSAMAGPAWEITSEANTTAAPGGTLTYLVTLRNIGDGFTDGSEYKLAAELPPGILGVSAEVNEAPCPNAAGASVIICTGSGVVFPMTDRFLVTIVGAVAPGAGGTLTTEFEATGGGAGDAAVSDPTVISADPLPFGIDAFDGQVDANAAGDPLTQAGAHPYAASTSFDVNTHTDPHPGLGPLRSVETPKDVVVELPPGFVGDPTGAARCTSFELANGVTIGPKPLCAATAQVGTMTVRHNGGMIAPVPVFNMVPPPDAPARFGFNVAGTVVTLNAKVRTGSDYGLTIVGSNLPEGLSLVGTTFTFWGVPSDPSHDAERACPGQTGPDANGPRCPSPAPRSAFLRNPTACTPPGVGLATTLRMDSWEHPGDFAQQTIVSHALPGYPLAPAAWGPPLGPDGCAGVPFSPTFSAQPLGGARAGSPGAMAFDITVPQSSDPDAIGQSDLKRATVTLPVGLRISPASADGLQGCSSAQIALRSDGDSTCPPQSKLGTVTIDTPLLDEQVKGSAYLAKPFDNPFDSLVAIYLVAKASGVVIKLPGQVSLDPATGQITTTFDSNPQLPFSRLHLEFKSGPRAPLVMPGSCRVVATHAELEGWSGKIVTRDSSFALTEDSHGRPCQGPGFSPSFSAGTVNPLGGAFTPFGFRLSRSDDDQEFGALTSLSLPPGLLASLRGTSYCPDSALDAADTAKSPDRTGVQELAAPSCPASSRIGTATVGAGAGLDPFYVDSGRVYLAGPYKKAPLSIAVSVPAVAGPFDLGNVVVRSALFVDPSDASLRAVSDPFPTILDGIPLQIKDIRLSVDRPDFTLNPTSCDPMAVSGTVLSTENTSAGVSSRFQVGSCDRLAFKPKLSLRLKGKVKRGGYPSLRATLKMPAKRGANIARASVSLPHSEFLAQGHIRTICTRVQFAAGAGGGAECPKGSVYGHARAFSPLLDRPLEGPVFLRSSDNELPDLVAALDGQIHIDLVGRIDSVNEGIRNTFDLVPDAPVSKFVLTMQGGKKGLLENSRNICRHANRANVLFDGQNGKIADSRPVLKAACGKGKGKRKR